MTLVRTSQTKISYIVHEQHKVKSFLQITKYVRKLLKTGLYFYSMQKLIWSDVTIQLAPHSDREQGTKRWCRNNRKVTTLPSAVEGKCKILTGIF